MSIIPVPPSLSSMGAGDVVSITALELVQFLEDEEDATAVVDVRDTDYAGGHIRGCINLPFLEFDRHVQNLIVSLRTKKRVVFHCFYSKARGPKSARIFARYAAMKLRTNAPDVLVLNGGMNAFVYESKQGGVDGERILKWLEGYDPEAWEEEEEEEEEEGREEGST